jgi:DNA-binding response OmpR family regulator
MRLRVWQILTAAMHGMLSQSSDNHSTMSSMKILFVEDEQKIARAIKQGFKHENLAVELAFDADSGLSSALYDSYDLIILDRMLPGSMDGLDICREIRKKGIQTPVLMLTAKTQVRDKVEGLNAGADDYLSKPFSFEELLARVRALLRRPQDTIGTVLAVGDLRLDTIGHKVTRAEKEIALTSTEYSLLEYLMRNEAKVVSKTNIINHVWDFDADVLPNTVEAYVGYLRNKIDKPFPDAPPLIKTVRGFGYKIEA